MTTKNPNTTSLYELGLGDSVQFTDDIWVLRVPGGWLFTQYFTYETTTHQTCFVPYSNEFNEKSPSIKYQLPPLVMCDDKL